MKITPKILSIPPYVSTAWENISSLHVLKKEKEALLILSLKDGIQMEIPHLSEEELHSIFEAHAEFSSQEDLKSKSLLDNSLSFTLPFKTEGPMFESLGAQMQHNPDQANLPPLPPHILEKIGSIIKAFGFEESALLDKPQPDCNCMYCQLSRSLQGEPEEIVEDADLQFRDWEVTQKQDKLYHVVNPLDQNEYYDVYLGDPLGCTCGAKNCEHIRAALHT